MEKSAEMRAFFLVAERKEETQMAEKIKMEFGVCISDRDIDDILDTAMYGINYWCDEAIPDGPYIGKCAHEQVSRGGTLKLHDAESGEYYYLTQEKFIQGIKKYLENPTAGDFLEFVDHELRIDAGNVDIEIADVIIQYALFGEIVFG